MLVTFAIPNSVVLELNAVAQSAGFGNAKQMVIAYLKAEVLSYRKQQITEPAQKQAEAIIDDIEIG